MANIIAVVWDFDKTLVNGYMEEPIFEHYGVDSSVFWREVNSLPEKYRVEQGVRVNPDTILFQTLYLIFDYPYKYYTFKHFEV